MKKKKNPYFYEVAGEKSAWKISLWRKHLSQVKTLSLLPGESQPRHKQQGNAQCWGLVGKMWMLQCGEGVTEQGLSNSPPSALKPWEIQVWREGWVFLFNIHEERAVFYMRFTGAFSHKTNVLNHFCLKSQSQTLPQLPLPSCSSKTPSPQPWRGRIWCQPSRSSSNTSKLICDPHISVIEPEIINHPLKMSICGCAAQPERVHGFQRGEKIIQGWKN